MTHILRVGLFWLGLCCSVINPSARESSWSLGGQEVICGQVGWDAILSLPVGNHRTATERSAERFLKRLCDPFPYPKA